MHNQYTGQAVASPFKIIPAVLLLGLLITTRDINAMTGFFGEYTLFSAVSGRIMNGDKPITGATISQSAKLGATNTETQTTVSDSDGSFSFPAITRKKGLSSLLPQQFGVGQNITITVDGKPYEGWLYTKSDPGVNSENAGKPVNMVCDIKIEPDFSGETYGVCKLI